MLLRRVQGSVPLGLGMGMGGQGRLVGTHIPNPTPQPTPRPFPLLKDTLDTACPLLEAGKGRAEEQIAKLELLNKICLAGGKCVCVCVCVCGYCS